MAKDSNNQMLAVSQKIYGRLLLAYPKAHREEYGPAMAQLFRDQCHDAWNEARGLGVIKLWLRVLPDLVNTSIAERLSTLNQRKSMSDKLANLSRFRQLTPLATFFAVFVAVFVVVFLLVFVSSVAITFILPESYASTAQITVEQDADLHHTSAYDPHFLQTTVEIIQSQLILEPVIDKLNLNETWGKKYGVGTFKTSETVGFLTNMMTLSPVRNTSLVDITVYSADKKEAAQIANAIAESYQDYRVKFHATLTSKGVDALQLKYQEQEAQIKQVQSDVDSLRLQFKIASDASASQSPQEQPYWDKKNSLQQLMDSHKSLGTRIEAERLVARFPKYPVVEITKLAEPGREPVRPNKPLNIVLGAISGILLALVVGGIAALIAFFIRKRTRKNPATA